MLFGVPHSKGGSIIASHSNLNVTGTRQLQSPTRWIVAQGLVTQTVVMLHTTNNSQHSMGNSSSRTSNSILLHSGTSLKCLQWASNYR